MERVWDISHLGISPGNFPGYEYLNVKQEYSESTYFRQGEFAADPSPQSGVLTCPSVQGGSKK